MAAHTTFAFYSLAATALLAVGCADAITFTKSDRARARIALTDGDHETASEVFQRQVQNNPRDYRAHVHLGQARLAAGNETAALRSFRTALDVLPLTPIGRTDTEYRQLIINEYARTLADVDTDGTMTDELDRRAKGDVTMKLLVARTHGEAGRPDAAIASFQEARRLDREDQIVAKQYGLYLESIRQDAAAEEVLRRAYALDSRDTEVAAALRRLGIVPGPAILSRNDLAKPKIPLGPLPEVKLHDPDGEADEGRPMSAFDDELN